MPIAHPEAHVRGISSVLSQVISELSNPWIGTALSHKAGHCR
jgi:hypothetical protein